MSGHPHQGGYDDGYGQGNDAYYQEEHHQQGYGQDDYEWLL